MTAPSVLFVDHAAVMGGAQLSLLDIAEAFRERSAIALLEDGPFAAALESRGVRVLRIGGGDALRSVKKRSVVPGVRPELPPGHLMSWASYMTDVTQESRSAWPNPWAFRTSHDAQSQSCASTTRAQACSRSSTSS